MKKIQSSCFFTPELWWNLIKVENLETTAAPALINTSSQTTIQSTKRSVQTTVLNLVTFFSLIILIVKQICQMLTLVAMPSTPSILRTNIHKHSCQCCWWDWDKPGPTSCSIQRQRNAAPTSSGPSQRRTPWMKLKLMCRENLIARNKNIIIQVFKILSFLSFDKYARFFLKSW